MSRADLALKRDKGGLNFLATAKTKLLRRLAAIRGEGWMLWSEIPEAAGIRNVSVIQLRNELLEAELIEIQSFRTPPGSFALRVSDKGRRSLTVTG